LIINNKVPPPSEPRAEQRPFVRNLHGIRLTDEYAWLKAPNWREVMRDPQQLDPAIRAYLQAENGYCERLPKQATQEIKRHQSSRSIASDQIHQPRRSNPHSARGTAVPSPIAVSSLGGFRTPAAGACRTAANGRHPKRFTGSDMTQKCQRAGPLRPNLSFRHIQYSQCKVCHSVGPPHELDVNQFRTNVTRGALGNGVMRRMTFLAAAGAVAVAVGIISFTLGRTTVQKPVATVIPTKVVEPEPVTGTIVSRPIPAQSSAQSIAFPLPTRPAAFPTSGGVNAAAATSAVCTKPDALGVSRVVEIDATGGPGFGFEHFKQYDFLRDKEVVLTFDDGPWPGNTNAVLNALADECLRATFFEIGEHATWHPEITKQVIEAGMTVGTHTWSHKDLARNPYAQDLEQAEQEIEMGNSAVQKAAAGAPIAPFFRFPDLQHPPQLLSYLGERNIAIFSTDIDSFDFKLHRPEQVIKSVMTKLEKHGKGIILMHDFQHATAEAMPELIHQLKTGGYKVVHIVPRGQLTTLPKYDEMVTHHDKLSSNNTRPENSVLRTIGQ
jgi:peptidoglycan/xylan/chitin deacetylase (PgdA/CDA1 family)